MGERVGQIAKAPEVKQSNSNSRVRKTERLQSMDTPAERILFLQRTVGNQTVSRLMKSRALQAKLRIGKPGDVYEQEADRVADEVMRIPEQEMQRQVEPEEKEEILQTKPLVDQITPVVQRQVEEEEEEEMLQAKSRKDATSEVTNDLESQINAIKGGGRPLGESERAFFEPRFGANFNRVRVHTDTRAADSARSVNARAFTTGQDVVFGAGQYAPTTPTGKKLLAHELTHVVQQSRRQARGMVSFEDMIQKVDGRELPAPLTDNEWIDVVQPALAGAIGMAESALQTAQQAENSVPQPVGPQTTADLALHSTQLIATWFVSTYWEDVQSIREVYERFLQTLNSFTQATFTVVTNADSDHRGTSNVAAYVNCNSPEEGIFLTNRFFGRSDEEGDGLQMGPNLSPVHKARVLVHETAHLHILHSGHAGGEFPEQNFSCNEGLGLSFRQAIQNAYAWDHFAFCAQGGIISSSPGRLETLLRDIQQRQQQR